MFWFLLFSLVPFCVMGYVSYSTASKALQADVEEKLTRISVNNLDKIDRILLERVGDVQVWSALELSKLAVQIGSGIGGASQFVDYLIEQYRVYRFIMLLDRDGICVTVNSLNHQREPLPTDRMFLGQNFQQETWFINAMKGDGVVVTDWHKPNVLEEYAIQTKDADYSTYSMIFASAIYDDDGSVSGLWVNMIHWDVFQEILDQIHVELPDVSTSFWSLLVLGDDDTIVASSGIGTGESMWLAGRSVSSDLQQPQLSASLAKGQGVLSYDWNGQSKTIAFSQEKGFERYTGNRWKYVIIADNHATYASIMSLRSHLLGVGGFSMAAILLCMYLVGNRFARPLVLLSDTAAAIANGDLTRYALIQAEEKTSVPSRDEVELLVRAFQQMTASLHRLIMQMKDAITKVNLSSEYMTKVLERLSHGAERQSESIISTTTSAEEFVSASREIAKEADTVAMFAESTQQEAYIGVKAAFETLLSIQSIQQTNDQNLEYVNALKTRSQEIDTIVELITHIADTTDLIAFNAELEAVGAGEKGKRFGVVANEIRRLANSVATSVKHITRKTSDMQHSIHQLVNTFDTETQRIEEGVSDMKITTTALDSILIKIEKTTMSLMQISAATKEQQTANEHIVTVLHTMSHETRDFQAIAQQALEITTELNHLSEELQQTVNVFQVEEGGITP